MVNLRLGVERKPALIHLAPRHHVDVRLGDAPLGEVRLNDEFIGKLKRKAPRVHGARRQPHRFVPLIEPVWELTLTNEPIGQS